MRVWPTPTGRHAGLAARVERSPSTEMSPGVGATPDESRTGAIDMADRLFAAVRAVDSSGGHRRWISRLGLVLVASGVLLTSCANDPTVTNSSGLTTDVAATTSTTPFSPPNAADLDRIEGQLASSDP